MIKLQRFSPFSVNSSVLSIHSSSRHQSLAYINFSDSTISLSLGLWCCCWRYCNCHKPNKDCRFYAAIYWVWSCHCGSLQEDELKRLVFSSAIYYTDVVCYSSILPCCWGSCMDSGASNEWRLSWSTEKTIHYHSMVCILKWYLN